MARTGSQEAFGRVQLTREVVIGRALSLADDEGLEALTVRRLARELGVTPMALYWHFRNKDKLLDGIVDHIFARADLTVDEDASWQEQFGKLIGSLILVLRAHPSAAVLLSSRPARSENALDATEVALDILRRAGFSPTEATHISRHALRTAITLVSGQPGSAPRLDAAELQEAQRRSRVLLETLPSDRYPRIIEAAVPLAACEDPDAYYAFGLDLLLAGIEALASRERSGQDHSSEGR